MSDEIRSILLIQMDDHLRIGMRLERVAAADHLLSQCLEVVDLAVEDHPDGAVFVRQRLMTGVQINDAEPPHAQSDVVADKEAAVIRSPMRDGRAHALHFFSADRAASEAQNSRNATHVVRNISEKGSNVAPRAGAFDLEDLLRHSL